ncbi:hypothetical protein ACUH9Y_06310 [Dermabacteraceae bacterium P13115]
MLYFIPSVSLCAFGVLIFRFRNARMRATVEYAYGAGFDGD